MTKIAYNQCYGGFGLSMDGIARYVELKGLSAQEANDLYSGDIDRADPVLIQVIEEMGEDSWGPYANLDIRELATGTKYIIDDYDGNERVMTVDDFDWKVA